MRRAYYDKETKPGRLTTSSHMGVLDLNRIYN